MEKNKIMLVDDEKDFLRMVKLNLEETGKYEVRALSSAKNIISELHGFRPDLILLDILMPNINGMEVCDMLNKDPMGIGVPVIILSALQKDRNKIDAFKAGVVDYLTKPIESGALIAKIDKALAFKKNTT